MLDNCQGQSTGDGTSPASTPKPSFTPSNYPLNSMSTSSDMLDNCQGQSTGDGMFITLFVVGGAVAFIMTISITIVAISVGICLKIKRVKRESIGTLKANNIKAHRIPFPDKSAYVVESNSDSEMELNKAYIASTITKSGKELSAGGARDMVLLDTSGHIYTNPKVAGDIEMEQNKAYATSIITERNNAYIL